jgi:hypothetical protein
LTEASVPTPATEPLPATEPTPGIGRRRWLVPMLLVGLAAGVVGAWIDWLWWPVYVGLTLTLAAIAITIVGGILALIPRRPVRLVGVVVLAVGIGLLLGQNLGPSREPLLVRDGSITIRLEAPYQAMATGPATCSTVESGTEFSIYGDPNLRLDTAGEPFVMIATDTGNRWRVRSDAPTKDGVLLQIGITQALVAEDGKPSTTGMQATPSSTLESTFTPDAGRIRFAGLSPMTGVDYNGDSIDLAGTVEWTCGSAAS